MSTKAIYTFIGQHEVRTNIYKHSDGYPKGAYEAIKSAVSYGSVLAHFNIDVLAASFIIANSSKYSVPHVLGEEGLGEEYRYEIYMKAGEILVKAYSVDIDDEKKEFIFSGTLEELKDFKINK